MSRLRAIFLWLMMLALPFQGYAAVAMAACQPAAAAGLAAQSPHHPAMHDHHHGASHAADHPMHGDLTAHHDDPAGSAGAAHKCSTCATCHSVGITPTADTVRLHGLPRSGFIEPSFPPTSLTLSVPYKPPRA